MTNSDKYSQVLSSLIEYHERNVKQLIPLQKDVAMARSIIEEVARIYGLETPELIDALDRIDSLKSK